MTSDPLPHLKLCRVKLKNFRLWKDTTLVMSKGVPTVLIGPNGSGKSAWIDIFHLMKELAGDSNTDTAIDKKRRGIEALSNASHSEKSFGVAIVLEREFTTTRRHSRRVAATPTGSFAPQKDSIDPINYIDHQSHIYAVTFAKGDQRAAEVKDERYTITTRSTPQGDVTGFKDALLKDRNQKVFVRGERSFKRYDEDGKEIESRESVTSPSGLELKSYWQPQTCEREVGLRRCFESIFVYPGFATSPLWAISEKEETARLGEDPRENPRLDKRGTKLVMALYHIFSRQPQAWERLTYHFCAEFPSVQRLYFPLTQSRMVLAYEERRTRRDLELDDMSEGMIAYLSLLCALLVEDHS